MRRVFVVGFILMLASFVSAVGKDDTVKMNGYLIDNACSGAHSKDADFSDRVKRHSKSCALMPGCVKSGYSILVDDKLYKLDEAGNKMVADFLKKTKLEKGLEVSVEGTIEGDTLHVKTLSEKTE